jgi:methionyl-tRNA synthetase
MHKLCGGKVPKLHDDVLDDDDKWVIKEIKSSKMKVENLLEEYKFRDALYEVLIFQEKGTSTAKKEPWKKLIAQGKFKIKRIDNCSSLFAINGESCHSCKPIFTKHGKENAVHDESG